MKSYGKQLKTLGRLIFILNIIVFGIAGIASSKSTDSPGMFFLCICFGIISGWCSSIALLAFGQLVDDVNQIKCKLYGQNDSNNTLPPQYAQQPNNSNSNNSYS